MDPESWTSEQAAALIDEEVQHLISDSYSYIQYQLAQHREELERESLDKQKLVKGSINCEAGSENEATSGSSPASTLL